MCFRFYTLLLHAATAWLQLVIVPSVDVDDLRMHGRQLKLLSTIEYPPYNVTLPLRVDEPQEMDSRELVSGVSESAKPGLGHRTSGIRLRKKDAGNIKGLSLKGRGQVIFPKRKVQQTFK